MPAGCVRARDGLRFGAVPFHGMVLLWWCL
jgi:hypothetical protein